MGKKLIIPGADFSQNAIILNGIKLISTDGNPINVTFYRDNNNTSLHPGVIVAVQSGVLTAFANNSEGATTMDNMLREKSTLKKVALSYEGNYSFIKGFMGCTSLEYARIDGSIRDGQEMFSGCSSLKTLDIADADFSSCQSIQDMFAETAIESLDLREMTFGSVTSMMGAFKRCEELKKVSLPDNLINSCTLCSSAFLNAISLEVINFGTQDFSSVTSTSDWLTGCPVRQITGTLSNIGKNASVFGIGGTSRYDSASMDIFINGLYDNSGADTTKKFYISQYNSDNLTIAQRDSISSKNWEIMIASL